MHAHEHLYLSLARSGYRESPIAFPTSGLLMGVAERYDVVCDFTRQAGSSIYLYNGRNL